MVLGLLVEQVGQGGFGGETQGDASRIELVPK